MATVLSDLPVDDTHQAFVAHVAPVVGLTEIDNLQSSVGGGNLHTIIDYHRRRWDMITARQRLELQGQAICREFTKGDKDEAAKLWQLLAAGGLPMLDPRYTWTQPFREAMQPLVHAQKGFEKVLEREVRKMPCYSWAKGISGFGDISYAAVIAECAGGAEADPWTIGDYRSPAALWKRMGLAVVTEGRYEVMDTRKGKKGDTRLVEVTEKGAGRQRLVAGDEALAHGYVPRRRAIMWNIGASIIKKQVVSARRQALPDAPSDGPYGEVYRMRKEYELARGQLPIVAHRRAQRYMEKRLLRDLWREWRKI